MVRKQKKKHLPKKGEQLETKHVSTDELISKSTITSDNVIRLKLTTRKGSRVESVPLKKLEKLANNTKLYWKLDENWLILVGLT